MIDMFEFDVNKEMEELADKIIKESFKTAHPFIILKRKQHLKNFLQNLGPEEKEKLSGLSTLDEVHEKFCKDQRLEKPKLIGCVRIAGEIPYDCFLDCKCGFCQTKKKDRRIIKKPGYYGFR